MSEKVKLLADTIRATSVPRTFTTEQFEASTRHNGGIYLCINNANLGLRPNCFIMWCASATSENFPRKECEWGCFQPLVMLISQRWSLSVQCFFRSLVHHSLSYKQYIWKKKNLMEKHSSFSTCGYMSNIFEISRFRVNRRHNFITLR